MTWNTLLQYRGDVFMWTLVEAVTPLVALALWFTITSQNTAALQPRDTLTYYILTMLIVTATASWTSYFLTQEILDGQIVRYLARPLPVFWHYAADNILVKLLRLALPLPAAVTAFLVAPQFFSPSIYEPSRLVLAVISVALGAAIAFLADAVLSTLAFWLEDVHQILGYHYLLWTIGSGILIPYIFLPEFIRTALSFLPYRYIVSAPIEILVAPSATSSPLQLLGVQLAWVAGLTVALRLAWQQGLKRYAIPGQ